MVSFQRLVLLIALLLGAPAQAGSLARLRAKLAVIPARAGLLAAPAAGGEKVATRLAFEHDLPRVRREIVGLGRWLWGNESFRSLNDSLCAGASTTLQAIMQKRYPNLVVERVHTYARVGNGPVAHIYLKAPRYFSDGSPLVIDPTIRQFFKNKVSKTALKKIPQLFVGSEAEVHELFARHFSPEELAKHRWVETYLDAGRAQPHFSDAQTSERLRSMLNYKDEQAAWRQQAATLKMVNKP
jgi:hypothetical protein